MGSPTKIHWSVSPKLSEIHAALNVAMGRRVTDQKVEQALVKPATEINHRLLSASIDVTTFWNRLFSETAFDADNDRACEIALVASFISSTFQV